MDKKQFFSFIFIFLFHISFSQEKSGNVKIDSLINLLPTIKVDTSKIIVLNEIAINYGFINPSEGINYANKALKLSKKINYENGICVALLNLGQNNDIGGNRDEAFSFFTKALPFAKTNSNKCRVYRSLGVLNSSESNYTKALEYHFKALKIIETTNDEKELANVYFSISNAYSKIDNQSKAFFYGKKSLAIYTKLYLKDGLLSAYFTLFSSFQFKCSIG